MVTNGMSAAKVDITVLIRLGHRPLISAMSPQLVSESSVICLLLRPFRRTRGTHPADHRDRKGDPRGVLLWRQSHADLAAQSIQRALVRLVDQVDWPAAHVLALHAEGGCLVPQAQYEFQGGCRLTFVRSAFFSGRTRLSSKADPDVRFGSKADVRAAKRHVRFAPESDRESGFSQTVMSTLPLKIDMCGALAHVCFRPKADIGTITSDRTATRRCAAKLP
jgi:hypothetical protein